MLTYFLCKLYLEFLLSLSTFIIMIIVGIILVLGFLGGGNASTALGLIAVVPVILYFFGWIAEFLKNSWFLFAIFGWAIYIAMDFIWIMLFILLVARLFK